MEVDHVNRLGWTALHEAIILGDGSQRYVDTVRELVAAFERVHGRSVPLREAPPRQGDTPGAYANVDR